MTEHHARDGAPPIAAAHSAWFRPQTWPRPWLVVAILLLALLVLVATGWWRSTGTGPQVQVPMFYDAHYLFPRPWTQEQTAPGVPAPAGLAFYGDNRVSQTFVSGSDRLAMVELWLAGDPAQRVALSLSDGAHSVAAELPLIHGRSGGTYQVRFPAFDAARGRAFVLTLTAPQATADAPVTTQTVGGDRIGGALRINEFLRPGNLALQTYGRGLPGAWWLQAIGEQLLPAQFRLRLQQYKPAPFKGGLFAGLLALTGALTVGLLVLAAPTRAPAPRTLLHVLGWSLALILLLFLAWQLASGRLRLPFITGVTTNVTMARPAAGPITPAPAADMTAARLVDDFTAVLWTGEREPEARFVHTQIVDGLPAVRVPAESRLGFARTLPPHGRLRVGLLVPEEGALRMAVRVGDMELAARDVAASDDVQWLALDLSPWAGQAVALELVTTPLDGAPDGLWLMPQLSVVSDWLLPEPLLQDDAITADGSRFGTAVELAGSSAAQIGDDLAVTLYWRPLAPVDRYATVFVHLLDADGQLVAQHDGAPVGGAYPFPLWQTGTLVVDRHTLALPADLPPGRYTLAVGIYDPDTLARWPVTQPDGTLNPDGRGLLQSPVEISR